MITTATLIKQRSALWLIVISMLVLLVGEVLLVRNFNIPPTRVVLALIPLPALVAFGAFAALWWLRIQRRPSVGFGGRFVVLEKAWFWIGSFVFIAIEFFYYGHFVFGIL
jgi:hypothetical protein